METIYSRHKRYDVVRKSTLWGTKFYVYADDRALRGPCATLRAAVEAAGKGG